MSVTNSIVLLAIVATPIDRVHYFLLMHTTGLVEVINITGVSVQRLQMLGTRHGVCALESSGCHCFQH